MRVRNINDTYQRGRKNLFIAENHFALRSDRYRKNSLENVQNRPVFSLSLKIIHKGESD